MYNFIKKLISKISNNESTFVNRITANVSKWWLGEEYIEALHSDFESIEVKPSSIKSGVNISAAKSTSSISSSPIVVHFAKPKILSVNSLQAIGYKSSDSSCSCCSSQKGTYGSNSSSPRFLLDGLSELDNEPFVQMENISSDFFVSEYVPAKGISRIISSKAYKTL